MNQSTHSDCSAVLDETTNFYQSSLSSEPRDYLYKRGFTDETILKFHLGYAGGDLKEHLLSKGYSAEEGIEAGVLVKDADTGQVRDFFFNSITIPNIIDGEVVHITARTLGDTLPKYLELKGKVKYLFNEQIFRDQNLDSAILAESPMDNIAGLQSGFPFTSLYGLSSFQPEVVKAKLKRVKEVLICFHSDLPGRLAAFRFAVAIGSKVKIILLPPDQDLDEYLKNHSKADFEKLIDEAKTAKEFMVALLSDGPQSPTFQICLNHILIELAKLDLVVAEQYLAYIKSNLNIDTHTMQAIRSKLSSFRKQQKKKKKKKDVFASFIIQAIFEGLVDLGIGQDGQVYFLVKEGDNLVAKKSFTINGETFVPPPLKKIPWLLARIEKVIEYFNERKSSGREFEALIDNELYVDLKRKFDSAADLPDNFDTHLLVLTTILTYFLMNGQFQFCPYICFCGPPEHGKSRIGRTVTYCSYRGVLLESLREQHVFRLTEYFDASLFFDVRDLWRKANQNNSSDIFLLRSNRGATVPRVLNPDKGPYMDTTYFKIFGPTFIATNFMPDFILNSRCIMINMRKSERTFQDDVTQTSCRELRERLLAMRASYLHAEFPEVDKPAAGRLGEILRPIKQIINFFFSEGELPDKFHEYVQRLETQIFENTSEGPEVTVLKSLFVLRHSVEAGLLSIEVITREFNSGRAPQYRISTKSMGWILKKLNFKKDYINGGNRAIKFDLKLLKAHMIVNGLEHLIREAEQRDRESQGNVPPENS